MVPALHWAGQVHDQQHHPCLVVVIVPGRAAGENNQCDAVTVSEWSMGQHMEGGTPSPAFVGEGVW